MPLTKDFIQLEKNVKKEYFGKKVPTKYQERYGKRYDKKDIVSFSYAIAKSKNIKIEKRKKKTERGFKTRWKNQII